MIEDVYTFMAADTILANLVGGSGSARIYPDIAPQDAVSPYIVYSTNSDGGRDEILDDSAINFSVYGESKEIVETIKRRLIVLLDVQDQISIPSTDYIFKWSKKIGGFSTKENETNLYHRAIIIAFKFIRR